MNEIVELFDLASVHKSSAIVSVDRLAWLNRQHLRAGLAANGSGDAVNSVMRVKAQNLLMGAYGPNLSREDAAVAISLVRSRLNVVSDVVSESRFLFEEPVLQQRLPLPEAGIVQQFVAALQTATASMSASRELHPQQHSMDIRSDSAAAATAAAIDAVRAATKLKPPQLFPPIRVALTVRLN
jgi:glutamyl/glutaminyl-tRNA synthetase